MLNNKRHENVWMLVSIKLYLNLDITSPNSDGQCFGLADASLRSPRKLFVLAVKTYSSKDQTIPKMICFFLKTQSSLTGWCTCADHYEPISMCPFPDNSSFQDSDLVNCLKYPGPKAAVEADLILRVSTVCPGASNGTRALTNIISINKRIDGVLYHRSRCFCSSQYID